MIGLYAGSFSVPTMGHMDIIRRAATVLDGLVVAILVNPEKRYAFPPERRARWLEKAVEDLPNVRVVWDNGLLVDVAKRCGAGVIVRGVRGESDLGYEMPLAEANRHLAGLDTLFFVARPELAYLSSTIVMDIARHGGDVSEMIPAQVADDIVNAIKEC